MSSVFLSVALTGNDEARLLLIAIANGVDKTFDANFTSFVGTSGVLLFNFDHAITMFIFFCIYFFSIWVFFHEHSRITGLQGKGENIPLTPHYHFYPIHRHLDISRAITAESSLLHIYLAAELEPGTFGFRAQVGNH